MKAVIIEGGRRGEGGWCQNLDVYMNHSEPRTDDKLSSAAVTLRGFWRVRSNLSLFFSFLSCHAMPCLALLCLIPWWPWMGAPAHSGEEFSSVQAWSKVLPFLLNSFFLEDGRTVLFFFFFFKPPRRSPRNQPANEKKKKRKVGVELVRSVE